MKSLKTLPQAKKIELLIVIDLVLIALALCLINFTRIDTIIQNRLFFDFETKTWLFDKYEPIKKFIFYQFPKIIFGCAIAFCLVASILGFKTHLKNRAFFSRNRHFILLLLLGLTIIPLVVGNIKKFTNVYCPAQLKMYGGDKPYVKIFKPYPQKFIQTKKAQCFPAGHPVTGFALFILFFAFKKRTHRLVGFASAMILGGLMSFYQVAKGAHFFGDTLVSMLLCFLVAALIARFYPVNRRGDTI